MCSAGTPCQPQLSTSGRRGPLRLWRQIGAEADRPRPFIGSGNAGKVILARLLGTATCSGIRACATHAHVRLSVRGNGNYIPSSITSPVLRPVRMHAPVLVGVGAGERAEVPGAHRMPLPRHRHLQPLVWGCVGTFSSQSLGMCGRVLRAYTPIYSSIMGSIMGSKRDSSSAPQRLQNLFHNISSSLILGSRMG